MSSLDTLRRDADGYLSSRGLADARRPGDKLVRTYPPDRRCTCGTRLSIYNEDTVCAACTTERWSEH